MTLEDFHLTGDEYSEGFKNGFQIAQSNVAQLQIELDNATRAGQIEGLQWVIDNADNDDETAHIKQRIESLRRGE